MGLKKRIAYSYTTKSGRLTSPVISISNIPPKYQAAVEKHIAQNALRAGGKLRMVSSDQKSSSVGALTTVKGRKNFDAIFRKAKKGKK